MAKQETPVEVAQEASKAVKLISVYPEYRLVASTSVHELREVGGKLRDVVKEDGVTLQFRKNAATTNADIAAALKSKADASYGRDFMPLGDWKAMVKAGGDKKKQAMGFRSRMREHLKLYLVNEYNEDTAEDYLHKVFETEIL